MLKTIRRAALASVITFTFPAFAMADNLKVVATFSIIGDLAKNVGGDRIDLTTLVGPDGDAHTYEPKPQDAVAMSKADVVLVNGLHFEGFLERLVEASGSKATVAELTKGVKPLSIKEEEGHHDGAEEAGHDDAAEEAGHDHEAEEAGHAHDHGDIDPHAFQSVPNVKIYVQNIANAFCTADAAGCDAYKANAAAYTAELDAVDTEIRAAIAAIPEAKRTIITSHDAFGYLAHEYGLSFLAPEGITTEADPTAADVAELIRQVREDKASAIFVENITNTRLIEQIASETGLTVGGRLYSDALSAADGPASTYLDLMRYNVTTIKGAIVGS